MSKKSTILPVNMLQYCATFKIYSKWNSGLEDKDLDFLDKNPRVIMDMVANIRGQLGNKNNDELELLLSDLDNNINDFNTKLNKEFTKGKKEINKSKKGAKNEN